MSKREYDGRYSSGSSNKRVRSRSPVERNRDYPDDRRHSGGHIYLNPSSGGGGSSLPHPDSVDFQVSFKHFAEYSRRKMGIHSDEEIQKGFNDYKKRFLVRSLERFFEDKKEEEWFKEKYEKNAIAARKAQISLIKREALTVFLQELLEEGKYDAVNFDDLNPSIENLPDTSNDQDLFELEIKDISSSHKDHKEKMSSLVADQDYSKVLFVKSITANFKRTEIVQAITENIAGVVRVDLGEASSSKDYIRTAYIVLKDEKCAQDFLDSGKSVKLGSGAYNLDIVSPVRFPLRIRSAPFISGKKARLETDLEQAKKLVSFLDTEIKGAEIANTTEKIEEKLASLLKKRQSSENEEEMEIIKLKLSLDLYILYLRRVHFFDYYYGMGMDSLEALNRRCGMHFRDTVQTSSKNDSPSRFFERLDNKIQSLLGSEQITGSEVERLGGKDVEKEVDEFISKHIFMVAEAKFRCEICTKLFKGPDFVSKHIRKKHPEKIVTLTDQLEMFNAFVVDPNRPDVRPPQGATGNVRSSGSDHERPSRRSSGGRYHPYDSHRSDRSRYSSGRHHDNHRSERGSGGRESDPRQIKSYVDLDAPADGERAELSYD
ncbi:MAG: hypothetical protein SGCHY_000626 [Lobulomycetales sp.]